MATAPHHRLSDAEMKERFRQYDAAVEAAARGNWDHILASLGNTLLMEAVEKAQRAGGRRAKGSPCPGHGGTDGFSLFRDHNETGGGICNTCGPKPTGFSVLQWSRGWKRNEVYDAVAEVVGVNRADFLQTNRTKPLPPPKELPAPVIDPEVRRRQQARDSWTEKKLLAGLSTARDIDWSDSKNPVVRYFEYRGIEGLADDPPMDLYYIPTAIYSMAVENPNTKAVKYEPIAYLPSALAVMRDIAGEAVAYHRIWMTSQGEKPFLDIPKKERPAVKMTAGMPSNRSISGAAVRLYNADHTLGIGEGIETMLGARALMRERRRGRKLAVWATLTAQGLEQVHLPSLVNNTLIFADNDAPPPIPIADFDPHYGRGLVAAMRLRDAMIDRGGARIFLPPKRGTDWLDTHLAYCAHLENSRSKFYPAIGAVAPQRLMVPHDQHQAEVRERVEREGPRSTLDYLAEAKLGPPEGVTLFDPFDMANVSDSVQAEIDAANAQKVELAEAARLEAEQEARDLVRIEEAERAAAQGAKMPVAVARAAATTAPPGAIRGEPPLGERSTADPENTAASPDLSPADMENMAAPALALADSPSQPGSTLLHERGQDYSGMGADQMQPDEGDLPAEYWASVLDDPALAQADEAFIEQAPAEAPPDPFADRGEKACLDSPASPPVEQRAAPEVVPSPPPWIELVRPGTLTENGEVRKPHYRPIISG